MYLNLFGRTDHISSNGLTVTLDVFKYVYRFLNLFISIRLTVTLDVFKFSFKYT